MPPRPAAVRQACAELAKTRLRYLARSARNRRSSGNSERPVLLLLRLAPRHHLLPISRAGTVPVPFLDISRIAGAGLPNLSAVVERHHPQASLRGAGRRPVIFLAGAV